MLQRYIITSSSYLHNREALTCKTMHRLKVIRLSTNVVLMSIFEWYLRRIMVFLVRGRDGKNTGKEKKTDRRKKLHNSNNNNTLFGFTFYIKNYILIENIVWKKVVYTITYYSYFLCVAWYLKRSNDTPKLIRIYVSV